MHTVVHFPCLQVNLGRRVHLFYCVRYTESCSVHHSYVAVQIDALETAKNAGLDEMQCLATVQSNKQVDEPKLPCSACSMQA